jgi:hypothetical protein
MFDHSGQHIAILTIIWWWKKLGSEIYGDNLNSVRREASTYFRNKKTEYLKDKINELATNSKNKIIDLHRGINGFKRATNREIT